MYKWWQTFIASTFATACRSEAHWVAPLVQKWEPCFPPVTLSTGWRHFEKSTLSVIIIVTTATTTTTTQHFKGWWRKPGLLTLNVLSGACFQSGHTQLCTSCPIPFQITLTKASKLQEGAKVMTATELLLLPRLTFVHQSALFLWSKACDYMYALLADEDNRIGKG